MVTPAMIRRRNPPNAGNAEPVGWFVARFDEAGRVQHRRESWQGGRRRFAGTPALASGAALEWRHELHASGNGYAGDRAIAGPVLRITDEELRRQIVALR